MSDVDHKYQRLSYYYTILLDTNKSTRIIKYLYNKDILNFLVSNKAIYNSLRENKILMKNAIKNKRR